MFEEIKQKYDETIVTIEEFEEIEEHCSCYIECNGASGQHYGKNWYTVYEYDFYEGKKSGDKFSIYF